jgi:hypothetical protein
LPHVPGAAGVGAGAGAGAGVVVGVAPVPAPFVLDAPLEPDDGADGADGADDDAFDPFDPFEAFDPFDAPFAPPAASTAGVADAERPRWSVVPSVPPAQADRISAVIAAAGRMKTRMFSLSQQAVFPRRRA